MECSLSKNDQILVEQIRTSSPSLASVLEKRLTPDAKPITASKLNWTGLGLVILGMVTDPMFKTYFGDLISPEVLGKLIFGAGWGVIALRTFAKNPMIYLNWRKPFGDEEPICKD